ncbi:DnaD domain protein [Aerococcaceae bacterium DSM 111020]|nr:DnaD domain protein [Aerococcaceae bacterium DSM 111020]
MAQRRMFSKKITESDHFLDLPMSAQCLYFHINMTADDDGFVGNAKTIRRMIGASEDDLKLLLTKEFLIPFESGVVVIRDWKIHNYIRKDRYNETFYKHEKAQLEENENNQYQRLEHPVDQTATNGRPVVDQRLPQVRLGKDRLELGKDNDNNNQSSSSDENKYSAVLNFWQDNFGILNNFVIDNLRQWIDEMSPEVVMKALETSAGQDQYKYNYVNGILNNWYKKGLDTIEKIEANEVSFQNRKKQQSYKQQIREEPLPEWLTNDQQEEESQELEDAEDIIGKLNELYE